MKYVDIISIEKIIPAKGVPKQETTAAATDTPIIYFIRDLFWPISSKNFSVES